MRPAVCHLSKPAVTYRHHRSTRRRTMTIRADNPQPAVYANFQRPSCTPCASPRTQWALTPLSHPYLSRRRGGCFLLQVACPHGQLQFLKGTVLCCPDFPQKHLSAPATDRTAALVSACKDNSLSGAQVPPLSFAPSPPAAIRRPQSLFRSTLFVCPAIIFKHGRLKCANNSWEGRCPQRPHAQKGKARSNLRIKGLSIA